MEVSRYDNAFIFKVFEFQKYCELRKFVAGETAGLNEYISYINEVKNCLDEEVKRLVDFENKVKETME